MILSGVRRSVIATLVGAGAGLLSGCGGGAGSDSGQASSDSPLIATTTIWADITSNVACGEPVASIIPNGADPHTFELSLRDREVLEGAAVIVANGGGLEEGLLDVLTAVAQEGADVVELTSHVEVVDDDPHVWQDPRRVAAAIDAIEQAVVNSGRDASQVGRCADAYRAELEALDGEIADLLSAVPPERRVMVTNHDAFGYFADRYDVEVVGTVIPSSSTLGEASAGQLAALADMIEQQRVPAIFTERLGSATDAEALAERLGVAVVELSSDALDSDAPANSYIGMMRANAEAIAAALA
jgi:zinc/manganese transport system substrate-binding protein